ncbi:MAG TPA: type VI secretion system membrane subunit TssM, partial [Steroidobacteraceae bacterium]
YKGNVPWRMRMGLYRGNSLGNAARDAYIRELNRTLPPALGRNFEQQLQVSVSQPDRLYEYLKAYLMLGDDEHRDPTHLRFLSDRAWAEMYPNDAVTAQSLSEHFAQLLNEEEDRLQSISLRPEIIEQARFALRNARLPVLMFSRLRLMHQDDTKRAVRLDLVAGTGAPLVLVRRSGRPLSEPIPALFTREVFNEFNATGKYELAQQFIADAWVFGGDLMDLRQRGALLTDVLAVYEDEYIRVWNDVLSDVTIRSTSSPQELADVLGIISSPTSPLKGLLAVIADNTDLLRPDNSAEKKLTEAAEKALAAKTAQLEKMFGSPPATAAKPGTRVSQAFQQVRQLVSGAPGQAPIDQVLASLAQTHQQLQSMGNSLGDTSALDALTRSGQADALRSLQLVAKQLPGPVGAMIAQIGTQTEKVAVAEARGDLQRRYNEQVLRECRELVEGRYPINRSSGIDMPLGDFARVFGPNGVFDTFFRENLAALVDTSRSPWRWRPGAAPIGGSEGILRQFQAVQRIREVYFQPGSPLPSARFTLTPDSLDASATRFTLEVDGQSLEYRHGPQQTRAINWPGTAGAASFAFEDRNGPIPGLAKQGPWAWFRLLDAAEVTAQSDTRFRITFNAGGKSASVLLEASSIRNPFGRNALAGFRCSM